MSRNESAVSGKSLDLGASVPATGGLRNMCLGALDFVIKYLGSKRMLIPRILEVIQAIDGAKTVLDLFSGTSRVGHALKRVGYQVFANDHNAYAAAIATCYVEADVEDVEEDAKRLIAELNGIPGSAGYMTETFCERSRFFHPKNGERIDSIREEIARKGLPRELEAVLLVSLMEAADRVDSTTGVQMAYLKSWAPRATNDLELRVPDLLPRSPHGKGEAHELDAHAAAKSLQADVAYLDPPYNQHKYLGNYHVWESLIRWDKPEVYGIACKRTDCRERTSVFNSKPRAEGAMKSLLESIRARSLVISFSNEGYLGRTYMEETLAGLWGGSAKVTTIESDYKRYIGAKIGIHNPLGKKVGEVSHLRNKEFLYVVTRAHSVGDQAGAVS